MCQQTAASRFFFALLFTLPFVGLVGQSPVAAQPATGAVDDPPETMGSVPVDGPSPFSSPAGLEERIGPASAANAPGIRRGAVSYIPQSARSRSAPARWRELRREVVAPGFLVGSLTIGLADHLTDDPAAWRKDAAGYAARVGSTAGRLVLEAGATHGLAAATRLDLRFVPRRTGGVGPRLRHAVLAAVTARTPHGTRVPNLPRLAGTYSATLVEHQWAYGGPRFGDAALTLALSVGIDVAMNVVAEFTRPR